MRKSKSMRLASGLLVVTMLSTCMISGTFAKYTTSVNSEDSARVAKWGFTETSIDLTDLFKTAYDTTVNSTVDVIAPGTTNSDTFTFTYAEGTANAPEVSYSFTVDTTGSTIDDDIKNNPNILWQLDSGAFGTWDNLLTSIESLSGAVSGTKNYNPGELPAAFTTADDVHTITWKWIFDENASNKETGTVNNDVDDTKMGNKTTLDDVNLKITITATQID